MSSPAPQLNYDSKTDPARDHTRGRWHTFSGSLFVLICEGLMFPSGLLVSIFLARVFGKERFGDFTLIAAVGSWLEITITTLFARAAVKSIGDAHDTHATGGTILRVYLLSGLICGVGLALLSKPIAMILGAPIAGYLALYSIDVPLYALSQGYRVLLIGRGNFRQRALSGGMRWVFRLIVIITLVHAGYGMSGAVLGCIAASIAELCFGAYRSGVLPFQSCQLSALQLLGYALPLFGEAICLRIYDRLDLFALKSLGGTASQAGVYGIAQNLSLLPQIFGLAIAPLLLSSMSRAIKAGDGEMFHKLGRAGLRLMVILLPFIALVAGAATPIVVLLFKNPFAEAGPILAVLSFASLLMVAMNCAVSMLVAGASPRWALWLTAPLPIGAILGYTLLIPSHGPMGAAFVTLAVAIIGGSASWIVVAKKLHLTPPIATCVRSLLLSTAVFFLAHSKYVSDLSAIETPTGKIMLLFKLAGLAIFVAGGFALLGEIPPKFRPAVLLAQWRINSAK